MDNSYISSAKDFFNGSDVFCMRKNKAIIIVSCIAIALLMLGFGKRLFKKVAVAWEDSNPFTKTEIESDEESSYYPGGTDNEEEDIL